MGVAPTVCSSAWNVDSSCTVAWSVSTPLSSAASDARLGERARRDTRRKDDGAREVARAMEVRCVLGCLPVRRARSRAPRCDSA